MVEMEEIDVAVDADEGDEEDLADDPPRVGRGEQARQDVLASSLNCAASIVFTAREHRTRRLA